VVSKCLWLSQLALHEQGKEQVFRPTLLIVPSMVINQVYVDCATFFTGLLTPKLFYGSKSTTSNAYGKQDAIISPGEFNGMVDNWMVKSRDPAVSAPTPSNQDLLAD
jgi:hypothetical protein